MQRAVILKHTDLPRPDMTAKDALAFAIAKAAISQDSDLLAAASQQLSKWGTQEAAAIWQKIKPLILEAEESWLVRQLSGLTL